MKLEIGLNIKKNIAKEKYVLKGYKPAQINTQVLGNSFDIVVMLALGVMELGGGAINK